MSLFELIKSTQRILVILLPSRYQSMLLVSAVMLVLLIYVQLQIKNDTNHILSNNHLYSESNESPDASYTNPDNSHDLQSQALAEIEQKQRLFLTVQPGDNLTAIFKKAGLGAAEVQQLTQLNMEAKILGELFPGDQLAFELDQQQLISLELIKSPLESFLFARATQDSFNLTKIIREPHIEIVYKEATITDSLFKAAQKGGIPANMTLELADIFGGVIDFMMDTREGDTYSVLFEEKYLDGNFIGTGRILAANYTNQGIKHTALRFENNNDESNYFNPDGESMRKAFLLNPVDFTRISSNFSLSRKHPILNTIRAHKGTDYAAPTGTPVVATADGRISFAGRNGSFGKLVVILHGDRYETRYAHLNDFAKGVKSGSKVKQGQVIGYVGSTGSATGPHLHFEFLMDGMQRNSRTIHDQLPKAESIPVNEMESFRQQTRMLVSMLNTHGASLEIAQSKEPQRRND